MKKKTNNEESLQKAFDYGDVDAIKGAALEVGAFVAEDEGLEVGMTMNFATLVHVADASTLKKWFDFMASHNVDGQRLVKPYVHAWANLERLN